MLRQLARLTAPVAAAGEHACAIAVYTDGDDRALAAADRGYEGVACVDDAARMAVLLCDVWSVTKLPLLASWAAGLADFLLYMEGDGRFANFIHDWAGEINETGPTSERGGAFWQARGTRALAKLWAVFGDDRVHDALVRALARIREADEAPTDVRAIHTLMAAELVRLGTMPQLRADLQRWADDLARVHHGPVLLDHDGQTAPHLWAHIQEGVLAEAGTLLDRPDLVARARTSAFAYLAPIVERGFALNTVQPYGVACAVFSLDRLAQFTGEPRFVELADKARAWFDGRNSAGRAVYDRGAGRVYDGIDHGTVNARSGAESNIVAAQALLEEVIARVPYDLPLIAACFDRVVA